MQAHTEGNDSLCLEEARNSIIGGYGVKRMSRGWAGAQGEREGHSKQREQEQKVFKGYSVGWAGKDLC